MKAIARSPDPDALRAAFACRFGVSPAKRSAYNLSRLLRSTGERPGRVEEARTILYALGLDAGCGRHWIGTNGVFDHGEMWARDGVPVLIVGHPYHIGDREAGLLGVLSRWSPTLRVLVDNRPSYYGYGSHHVRVELAAVHRPYRVPRSTRRTRAYARAARKAFRECFPEASP